MLVTLNALSRATAPNPYRTWAPLILILESPLHHVARSAIPAMAERYAQIEFVVARQEDIGGRMLPRAVFSMTTRTFEPYRFQVKRGNEMKMQKRSRSGMFCAISSALFVLAGCAPVPAIPSYKSNCPGPSPDAVLEIRLDAAGDPEQVVDKTSGKNADILIVCPSTKVSWELPGDRSFKIKFKRVAPFTGWSNQQKQSSPGNAKHELVDKIKDKGYVDYDGYKYTITVKDRKPLDPIIMVDR
jgi:hypothetical protein